MADFLKDKPVTQNLVASFIWQLIVWGVAVLLGALTSYSSFINDVPLYKAVINGGIVFLALALGGFFIGLAVSLVRRPNQKSYVGHEGPPAQEAHIAPPNESKTIKEPCADTWLHVIAEMEKQKINSVVRVVECWISPTSAHFDSPYVEFHFTIFNGSVYPITISQRVDGFILFAGRRLDGEVTMPQQYRPENLVHGVEYRFQIKQWLKREDADLILEYWHQEGHSSAQFDFENLLISIESSNDDVTPRPLLFSRFTRIHIK